jgi:hypothetical protein
MRTEGGNGRGLQRSELICARGACAQIDKYEAGSLARGECCLKWTFGKSE